MLIRKYLLIVPLAFFLFHTSLSAAEDSGSDKLSNMIVSKDEIVQSLDMLKKSGRISQADYDRAKKELTGMSDTQVSGLTDKALDMVKKDPAKADALVNGKKP
jgi:hypothetical protein